MESSWQDRTVTLGDWFVIGLLLCVPILNVIMLLVWAFGSNSPASKANWAKAMLLWLLIVGVTWLVLVLGMGVTAASFHRM